MEKKYYNGIDYAKFICAILVICVHTGPLLSINENANFFLVQIISRIAVPFFFVSSSFFFFKKLDYGVGLQEEGNINLLKDFILRIGKLYLIWTVVYLSLLIVSWIQGGFGITTIIRFIRDFFFTGSFYHLWFLPAVLFSVAFVYYLARKYKVNEILLISLSFYLIGMIINVYQDFLLMIPGVSFLIKLYLDIFVTARNGLFFGFIFTAMGYYFARKEIVMDFKNATVGAVLSFILLVLEAYIISWLGYMRDLTSMYLMLLPFIFYVFQLLMQFTSLHKNEVGVTLRKMSTLIYVSHVYFCVIISHISFLSANSLIFFILVTICSCGFSYAILYFSKRYRFLRNVY